MPQTNIKNEEKWASNPIKAFISESSFGGILLFLSAIVAVFLANSPWSESYLHFWENVFSINFNEIFHLEKTLHHWINDGLMSIFFFVVGLELKREFIGGELSNPKNAILPIVAAIGGMIVPALIYFLINPSGDTSAGWGIPMATDIAFALGVLYLLGDKIPTSLKVFLTALAIVDDLGAVLVIAFFYTSDISFISLAIALVFWLLLILGNKIGVRSIYFYAIIGICFVWYFFMMSGIHPTIAAVLVAFTIPANTRIEESVYILKVQRFLDRFKNADPNQSPILTEAQLHILQRMNETTNQAMTPLQRLEHRLHPFVTFAVMPIFALANAAVPFSMGTSGNVVNTVAVGVTLGLILGKFIGVVGFSTLIIKLKIAKFPESIKRHHLIGVGFLASIGFTMSLFVTNLAFQNPEYILQAKIGIFIASLAGGIIGFVILNRK